MPKRELIKMVPTINVDEINEEINDYIDEICDNFVANVELNNTTWNDDEDIHFDIELRIEIDDRIVKCAYDEMIGYKATLEDINETITYVKQSVAKEIVTQLVYFIKERG